MKRWLIYLALCLVLSGCSKNAGTGNTNTEDETGRTEAAQEEAGAAQEEAGATQAAEEGLSIDAHGAMEFLERFEPELDFYDMEEAEAETYVGELKDAYTMIGRRTEDGFGYVLAVLKEETSPLQGLAVIGIDDKVAAGSWNQSGDAYEEKYLFDKIEGLYQGIGNRILFFQPDDLATPEELLQAFVYQYCKGEAGIRYLQDVTARGVRLTPPESGAFLSVDRFEDGEEYLEYIPLSHEQEQEILSSDELIFPPLYGGYGLQLYVSEEEYEKNAGSEKHISTPALELAKEKCRFEVVELSEIHDIVKAEMKMRFEERDSDELTATSEREETETVTDPQKLAKLEEILASSEPFGDGKCPYTGVLTLTRKDGRKLVLHLVTDSCDGFVLGSHAYYSPGDEKTGQLWDLFPGMRENTGWKKQNLD